MTNDTHTSNTPKNDTPLGATASHNIATNWISLEFDGKPDESTRNRARSLGYKAKRYSGTWIWKASWSPEAEDFAMEFTGEPMEVIVAEVDYAARADRREELAEAAKTRARSKDVSVREISDNIPLGQPILVGHHSEKRHRRDLARIQNGTRKTYEEMDKVKRHQRAAEAIRARGERRRSPQYWLRKVEKLEAEERKVQRRRENAERERNLDRMRRLDRCLGTLAAQLDYASSWLEDVADELPEAAREDTEIKPGDLVKWRGWNLPVLRVNKKTVTVFRWLDIMTMTYRLRRSELHEHTVRSEQQRAEALASYKKAVKARAAAKAS